MEFILAVNLDLKVFFKQKSVLHSDFVHMPMFE